jgi:hypothetical protein
MYVKVALIGSLICKTILRMPTQSLLRLSAERRLYRFLSAFGIKGGLETQTYEVLKLRKS